mgnify:FL=1
MHKNNYDYETYTTKLSGFHKDLEKMVNDSRMDEILRAKLSSMTIENILNESDIPEDVKQQIKDGVDFEDIIANVEVDEEAKQKLKYLYEYIQGVKVWYIGTNIIGHEPISKGKRNKFDNNIYTFDIETTSYIILDGKQYNTIDYLDFTQEEKERSIFQGTMYIWMFGINDKVYYGRTYKELYNFLNRIEFYTTYEKKIVYVHNLAFEFNWLRNIFKFKNVMARKSRKVMKCEIEEYNIEFRCTLFMTNSKLEKIPDLYKFEVKKLVRTTWLFIASSFSELNFQNVNWNIAKMTVW